MINPLGNRIDTICSYDSAITISQHPQLTLFILKNQDHIKISPAMKSLARPLRDNQAGFHADLISHMESLR